MGHHEVGEGEEEEEEEEEELRRLGEEYIEEGEEVHGQEEEVDENERELTPPDPTIAIEEVKRCLPANAVGSSS